MRYFFVVHSVSTDSFQLIFKPGRSIVARSPNGRGICPIFTRLANHQGPHPVEATKLPFHHSFRVTQHIYTDNKTPTPPPCLAGGLKRQVHASDVTQCARSRRARFAAVQINDFPDGLDPVARDFRRLQLEPDWVFKVDWECFGTKLPAHTRDGWLFTQSGQKAPNMLPSYKTIYFVPDLSWQLEEME